LQPALQTQGSPSQEANTLPMPEPRAQRTLVKSPPEIWAEVSDVSTLARHLGEFGEIRITRLEAETTVVWEGDRARGTVELEASGWGTKVTITAEAVATDEVAEVVEAEAVEAEAVEAVVAEEAAPEATEVVEKDAAPIEAEVVEDAPEAEAEPEVEAAPKPEAAPEAAIATPRRGFLARLLRRRRTVEPIAVEPPPAVAISEPAPEPVAIEPEIVPTVAAPEPEAAEIPEALDVTEATEIAEPVLDGEITATAAAATAALDPERVEAVLVGVLDDLGSAHHRPFSRG
jgi:hypothetical protein